MLLTILGLLKLLHLIYGRLLAEFGMLFFFHKLKSSGISGEIFGHISSFLSKRQLQVDLNGKAHKNIELMLEFLKVPFLVLYFSDYTLMTFLMLSLILLSVLMILLFIVSEIKNLICGNM